MLDKSGLLIGVLMGGTSEERDVSLRSGHAIAAALIRSGYSVKEIDIGDDPAHQIVEASIDVAFIALHGRGGEDGIIQSILESQGIAYVGSGVEASLQSFDKERTKGCLIAAGIPLAHSVIVSALVDHEAVAGLTFPVFVKPVNNGSSIGVVRVETPEELLLNKSKILATNNRYMIEEAVVGREMTVGILGEEALPIVELKPKTAFYDYEAKYTAGMTEYVVPAILDDETHDAVQLLALRVFNVLGCRDFARVDMIIDKQNGPVVLELNSIPGFTETSLLPKAAQCAGISFDQLCEKIVSFAIGRMQACHDE